LAYGATEKEPERADTISELAKKLGLDLNKIENTAKEFNTARNENESNLTKGDHKT
jgi:hypothetical protein